MGELSGPPKADLAGGKGRAAARELGSVLRAGEGRRYKPESSGVGGGGEVSWGGGRDEREGEVCGGFMSCFFSFPPPFL